MRNSPYEGHTSLKIVWCSEILYIEGPLKYTKEFGEQVTLILNANYDSSNNKNF